MRSFSLSFFFGGRGCSEWCHCAAEYNDGGECRGRIIRLCTAEAERIADRAIDMDEEEKLIYDVRSYQVNNLS